MGYQREGIIVLNDRIRRLFRAIPFYLCQRLRRFQYHDCRGCVKSNKGRDRYYLPGSPKLRAVRLMTDACMVKRNAKDISAMPAASQCWHSRLRMQVAAQAM